LSGPVPFNPLGLPFARFDTQEAWAPATIQHESHTDKLIEHANNDQKDRNCEDR
jgi:hypothetical protein